MLIYIEHSGTKDHNEAVTKLRDYIEHEYGATVEFLIGRTNDFITLYDENLNEIVHFNGYPSKELLDMYLVDLYNQDNDNGNTVYKVY